MSAAKVAFCRGGMWAITIAIISAGRRILPTTLLFADGLAVLISAEVMTPAPSPVRIGAGLLTLRWTDKVLRVVERVG